MAEELKKATLYYKDGSSDKMYSAWIRKHLDGYLVEFSYGRRGSTQQHGCKTPIPVDLNKAHEIWGKLITEKTSKGYTPGADGTPFSQTENSGKVSGLVPQLLNPITEAEVQQYLDSEQWMMQEKKDGHHVMVQIANGEVIASNRKGLIRPIPASLEAVLRNLPIGGVPVTLDGELIGEKYYAFDILELERNLRHQEARERFFTLVGLLATSKSSAVSLVDATWNPEAKHKLFREWRERKLEGAVFKHIAATYKPGRPNSGGDMLKFKFVSTTTAVVCGIHGSKRSVELGLRSPVTELPVPVGNVTIPVNHDVPNVGDLVEIRYLYYFEGGSLYQPVYLGKRTDLDRADLINTLNTKQALAEEEEN